MTRMRTALIIATILVGIVAIAILATMPPDPDVEWHRTLLQTALQ